jgi:hypothetical protein
MSGQPFKLADVISIGYEKRKVIFLWSHNYVLLINRAGIEALAPESDHLGYLCSHTN